SRRRVHAYGPLPSSAVDAFLRERDLSRKFALQPGVRRLITRWGPAPHNPLMCPKGVRMRRAQTLAFAALFLAAFANPGQSAELPSQAKKAAAPEPATTAKKCNIGGVAGVLAANG